MASCYAYPPFANVPIMILRWSMAKKGFDQTPPQDLDEFAIGKAISMTLRRSGHMSVILRPEYSKSGLYKVTIECPFTSQVLDTYMFTKSRDGYERLSKEWKRYSVIYPTIDVLE